MSRDPQRLPDYLGHILEAIERIHTYVEEVDEVGALERRCCRQESVDFRTLQRK